MLLPGGVVAAQRRWPTTITRLFDLVNVILLLSGRADVWKGACLEYMVPRMAGGGVLLHRDQTPHHQENKVPL